MRIQWGRPAMTFLNFLVIALIAGCQSTYVRSAKIYMQQDDPENARGVLLEGSQTSPNDPELWYVLGKVYAQLEDWIEMDQAFVKAQSLSSQFNSDIKNTRFENWRIKYNAAVGPFNEGNYPEAIEILKTALIIKPDDAETLKRLGLCYLQTNQYELAEQNLEKAVAQEGDETDISSRRNLLLLYWQQERYEDVIKMADILFGMNTFNAPDMDENMREMKSDTIQKKALALQQLDRTDEAIATWSKVIESDPGNPDFYFNKAILLHSMERYEEAASAYLKAIELNPTDSEARVNAARALLGGEQYKSIVEVLEPWLFPDGTVSADTIIVQDMDPYMLLRAAYLNLGEEEKADELAKILVKLQMEPDDESGD